MSDEGPYTVNFVAVESSSSVPDIYANGRMPAAVRVAIKVFDAYDNQFPTSENWLQAHIRLVDYYDTSRVIPGSVWEFVLNPGEWYSTFSDGGWEHAGKPLSSQSQGDPATQSEYVVFYVRAFSPESRKFAVQVITPDEKIHYSNKDNDAKGVDIRAVSAIQYTTADLQIDEVSIVRKGPWRPFGQYYQTNTYISNRRSADHPFVKVIPHSTHSGSDDQPGWEWCWMLRDGGKHSTTTRHWYTFPMDKKTRTVGTICDTFFGTTETIDITVNQRPNAVCVTLLETEPQSFLGPIPGWQYRDTRFSVYDKYGNIGSFSLETSDNLMTLVVKDNANSVETNSSAHTETSESLHGWVQDLPADIQNRFPKLDPQEIISNLSSSHRAIEMLQDRFLKYRGFF
ncbi:hypothetical protein ACN42_g9949 [Penicillium freii]|uniref:Uncharacterized protein n=1 Tax=Penicillium freii TaxID=48697 RepID=A0A101MAX9_PENFR|nr:hypothetical protein ACN42_g9949 [Penicillium freii]